MPLLNQILNAYIGSTQAKAIYLGSTKVWDPYPAVPWLSAYKARITMSAGVTINFKCSSTVTITKSPYLSEKFGTITPTYTVAGKEGYFDIYPDEFPTNGSYVGFIYVTNDSTGDQSVIKICVGRNSATSCNVRVITGGYADWGDETWNFTGYSFDAGGHLCPYFVSTNNSKALIPAGQTDFSTVLIPTYRASDNVETTPPTYVYFSNVHLNYTDIHYAIAGTLTGYGEFLGCVNAGTGGGGGYAFLGPNASTMSTALDASSLTSSCNDWAYANTKPLATSGQYYDFTDAAASTPSVSLTYIDS